jgi:hypothetical protein
MEEESIVRAENLTALAAIICTNLELNIKTGLVTLLIM